ncbi:MAG TPA: hypothetical protein VFO99_07830 [Pyrinomonadaceae bacterium]|nr:hypothetical protein [Pyrinomonadaceae bacterium]
MKRSQRQLTFSETATFRKTAACPASATLLSFRAERLSPMLGTLVKQHLESCEFCSAELPLLAHHRGQRLRTSKPPEMPTNLRILAESILGEHRKTRV